MAAGIEVGVVREQEVAVPRDVAARITGLSERQLDYWASTGLIEPAVDQRVGPGRRVRLYGFVDLLSLLVAAELKNRRVSLRHIRSIVRHLRERSYDSPLSQLTFATIGREVYFMHDDGSWEGDLNPDQVVIHEVLNLEPLRARITAGVRRDATLAGRVERRRGTMGGKPVLAGTRRLAAGASASCTPSFFLRAVRWGWIAVSPIEQTEPPACPATRYRQAPAQPSPQLRD